MKKVVAIICAIFIFAFSLIGCGDKEDVYQLVDQKNEKVQAG